MKIDKAFIPPIEGVRPINKFKKAEGTAPGTSEDGIVVSNEAQLFQSLLKKAKEIPAVREDRVQTLTEQLETGQFKVAARKIAESFLALEG